MDFLIVCLNNGELKLANQRSHLGCMRAEGPGSRYAHIRQRDEYSRNHFVPVLIEASLIALPQKDVFPLDTSPNLCPFLLLDTTINSNIFEVVATPPMVAGLDVGGTKTNATLLDSKGVFLINGMVETPSRVLEGPEAAIEAMAKAMELALGGAGVPWESVRVIGLDTPGPASANGVISSKGSTNFSSKEWWGFDIRTAAEDFFKLPVVYNNDANAAALYAHQSFFGEDSMRHSSVSAIVGTGLGGGVVDNGRVIRGSSGMAGELGHIRISLEDLLQDDQPIPKCNCGLYGDLESIASLTGITKNLLPYWLSKYPNHPLGNSESMIAAAKAVRGYAEKGDELALRIFEQQAKAIGRMFSIAANFTDPDAYFVGGGIVEAEPHFRDWCMDIIRASTQLRDEQRQIVQFAIVSDLDMAGARGSALAALQMLRIAPV